MPGVGDDRRQQLTLAPAAPPSNVTFRRPRFGRSDVPLLVKIMASLGMCLVVSSLLTGVLETQLTRAALRRESEAQVRRQLAELRDVYFAHQRALAAETVDLAAMIAVSNLTDPFGRNRLQAALAASGFPYDLLDVVDTRGESIEQSAGPLHLDDIRGAVRDYKTYNAISYRPLAGARGEVQVFLSAIGSGPERRILVAGTKLDDGLADTFKSQIRNEAEVMLVVGEEVIGSTLKPPPLPPRGSLREARLPASVTAARLNGVKMLVAYGPVPLDDLGAASGGIGVAVIDPTGELDASLAKSRILASVILGLVAVALGWLLFRALIRPLSALDRTATRIAAGDLEASFDIKGHDEIARLARSLAKMTAESRAQAQRVADTSRRIVTAQDDERRRMERNLHDGAQQRLLTASLAVGMAKASRTARDEPDLASTLDEVTRHLDAALAELRDLARGIHPAILGEAGLGPALESLAEKSLVPARVEDPFTERLASPIEATAYFVVSEALANATKHALASAVTIRATLVGERLVVRVSDDGVGGADPSRGTGLLGLSDRLAAMGGTLTVDSPLGGGTRIVADLPCG